MKRLPTVRFLAIIIGGMTSLMIPSFVAALVLKEYVIVRAFLIPLSIGLILALSAVFFIRKAPLRLRPRDGFFLVFLVWVFSSLIGSLPYYFSKLGMSVCDSIFESTCGFATTGATTLSDIEVMPKPLLLWRSMSHWSGGMGIILLTVALMPLLGVGGFQLVKAEAPGPEKDN